MKKLTQEELIEKCKKHHDWLKRKYAKDNEIPLLIIRYDEDIEEKLSFIL